MSSVCINSVYSLAEEAEVVTLDDDVIVLDEIDNNPNTPVVVANPNSQAGVTWKCTLCKNAKPESDPK